MLCYFKRGDIEKCLLYFNKALQSATSNTTKYKCYLELGKCYKENVYYFLNYVIDKANEYFEFASNYVENEKQLNEIDMLLSNNKEK